MTYHSFDVTAKDRQMADRARCVCLNHILTRNSATLPRSHCYATMIRYMDMQQVCTQLYGKQLVYSCIAPLSEECTLKMILLSASLLWNTFCKR